MNLDVVVPQSSGKILAYEKKNSIKNLWFQIEIVLFSN